MVDAPLPKSHPAITAREIIAHQIPGTSAEVCFGVADSIIARLHAAGIQLAGPDDRILGKDEVDQVTREKCAEVAEAVDANAHDPAVAIRAIGRKA